MAASAFATEAVSLAGPFSRIPSHPSHPHSRISPFENGPPESSCRRVSRRLVLGTTAAAAQSSKTQPQASPSPSPLDSALKDPASRDGEPRAFNGEDGAVVEDGPLEFRRRSTLVCALASATLAAWDPLPLGTPTAGARERRVKTSFPDEDYYDAGNGLRYLELEEGTGRAPEEGEQVKVHFEVKFGPLTVVTTRESKLLGGNRSISEPYLFVLGASPGAERKRDVTENANGLFSAQAAPKPPKALYAAVSGMKIGGKRSVLVPAEQGYGSKGYNEIPPGAQVQLIIDLLDVIDLKQPST